MNDSHVIAYRIQAKQRKYNLIKYKTSCATCDDICWGILLNIILRTLCHVRLRISLVQRWSSKRKKRETAALKMFVFPPLVGQIEGTRNYDYKQAKQQRRNRRNSFHTVKNSLKVVDKFLHIPSVITSLTTIPRISWSLLKLLIFYEAA